jgi:Recombinase
MGCRASSGSHYPWLHPIRIGPCPLLKRTKKRVKEQYFYTYLNMDSWKTFGRRQKKRTPLIHLRGSPFDSTVAPPAQPNANTRGAVPALIEGVIPLPSLLCLRSKSALEGFYTHERMSAREISRLVGSSRSAVLDALDRFYITQNRNGHKRIGPLCFGFDYLNHQLVKNGAEQAAIRMMRQDRAGGLSLREIAGNLNLKLIPTKQNGVWQANTVRGILARA